MFEVLRQHSGDSRCLLIDVCATVSQALESMEREFVYENSSIVQPITIIRDTNSITGIYGKYMPWSVKFWVAEEN